MNPRICALAAIAVLAFGTSAVSFAQTAPAVTPPPPPLPNSSAPTPVPVLAPATPAPSASPSPGRRGRRGGPNATPEPSASPTETPLPPQFSTLDGVWEVQLQPLDGSRTKYSHLYLTQRGNDLSGYWVREDGKTRLTFTGSFDGRLFKLALSDPKTPMQMSGYAENFGDMVGLLTDGDPKHDTPFTASHRKRDRPGS